MARVGLEELRLKKMVASDESLELLSSSFASFPVSCVRLFLSETGTNRRGKEFGKNKLISCSQDCNDGARSCKISSRTRVLHKPGFTRLFTAQNAFQPAVKFSFLDRSNHVTALAVTLWSTHRLLTLHHHHVFKSSVQPEMSSRKHDLGRGCNGRGDVVRRSICNTWIHHSSSVSL